MSISKEHAQRAPTLACVLSHEFPSTAQNYFPPERQYEDELNWPFIQNGLLERMRNLQWAKQYHYRLRRTFHPDACANSGIDDRDDEYIEQGEWEEGDNYEAEEYEESVHSEGDSGSSETEEVLDEEEIKEELREELAAVQLDELTAWPRWNAARPGSVWHVSRAENDFELLDSAQSCLDNMDLDFEIALCQGEYRPDEVIKLVGEFYELIITMAHGQWKEGCISYAPHSKHPVNMKLAKELGYSQSALYVLERLPYIIDDRLNFGDNCVIPGTGFLQYINEENLRSGRCMPPGPTATFPQTSDTLLDPCILPLGYPNEHILGSGYAIVLDTKIGAVKAWPHNFGPSHSAEYHYAENQGYDPENHAHWHHFTRVVPAARYLRTLIQAYTDVVRIPKLSIQHPSQFALAGVRVKYW